MKFTLLAAIGASLASASVLPRDTNTVDYTGYKVLRVNSNGDAKAVVAKLASLPSAQWNRDFGDHIDAAVAPGDISSLKALGLGYSVIREDLGADIAAETQAPYQRSSIAAVPSESWYDAYHSYADHLQYLKDLQASFPSNSEIFTSGASYQGRALQGIHIWGSGGKGSRPAVLFHGTVHAREWITTMTVEYMAYTLLTRYGSDSQIRAAVDKFDFWILPVVNPDGFLYSQSSDRLWRKNRQPGPSSSSCVGRDVNRNWPYQWTGVSNGASTNPCDQTYKGQAAGDAPENKGLVALANQLRDGRGIAAYIDWHSYGQYILSPYGYDCNRVAANNAQLQSIAQGTARAISTRYGTKYTTGPSCSTLYATTGSSVDYVYDVAKATYAWTIELRDKGNYGFTLPASQIRPTVNETLDGIRYLLASI